MAAAIFGVPLSVFRSVAISTVLGVVALLGATPGAAATLQISPVSVSFGATERATALTLRNPGDTSLYGQIRVYQWQQSAGEDKLSTTDALIASPPLIEVAPHSEQLVRLIRPSVGPTPVEQTYRLIIDELLPAPATPTSGIALRLRYSVPVFVAPADAAAQPQLAWRLSRRDGHWLLSVTNSGGRHAQVASVSLQNGSAPPTVVNPGLLGYALAGQQREWPITLPATLALDGVVTLHARVNAQPCDAAVNVDAGAARP